MLASYKIFDFILKRVADNAGFTDFVFRLAHVRMASISFDRVFILPKALVSRHPAKPQSD